jgi:hypothetical protein
LRISDDYVVRIAWCVVRKQRNTKHATRNTRKD